MRVRCGLSSVSSQGHEEVIDVVASLALAVGGLGTTFAVGLLNADWEMVAEA